MKSQLAEVQTGFEPLFFHIQADFQWQRPFSEGRDDRFSEKTKKNLSQSYGRWIVGFHEPMTSAFFALKKGAENKEELKEFIASTSGHGYYEFDVANLRPNECKWLSGGMLIKPIDGKIKVHYQIHSDRSTGDLGGTLELYSD